MTERVVFWVFFSTAVNGGEKSRGDAQACRRRVKPPRFLHPGGFGPEDLSSKVGSPRGAPKPASSLMQNRRRGGNGGETASLPQQGAGGGGLRWRLQRGRRPGGRLWRPQKGGDPRS